jgi:hypothetical protein
MQRCVVFTREELAYCLSVDPLRFATGSGVSAAGSREVQVEFSPLATAFSLRALWRVWTRPKEQRMVTELEGGISLQSPLAT